jgi:steroid delta-isomerase-like uncharacterized protein
LPEVLRETVGNRFKHAQNNERIMTLEDNKAVIRRLYDAFSTGDLNALDGVFAADAVDHTPIEGQAPGVEGFKQRIASFRTSFPDVIFTVEAMIAEGGMVAERLTLRGTHGGEFMGISSTGKQVTVSMMSFNVLADGKIVERWRLIDNSDLIQQLGSSPQSGAELKKAEYYYKGKEVKGHK